MVGAEGSPRGGGWWRGEATEEVDDRVEDTRVTVHMVFGAAALLSGLLAVGTLGDLTLAWELGTRWPLLLVGAATGHLAAAWVAAARVAAAAGRVDWLEDPRAQRLRRMMLAGAGTAAVAWLLLPTFARAALLGL